MDNVGRVLLRALLVPLGGVAAITVAMTVILVAHRTLTNEGEWLEAGIFAAAALAVRLTFWIGLTAGAGGIRVATGGGLRVMAMTD